LNVSINNYVFAKSILALAVSYTNKIFLHFAFSLYLCLNTKNTEYKNMQQQILQEVVEHLTTCGINYMLSGSLAMCVYATPRFTRDFDIVVAIDIVAVNKLSLLWADEYYYSLPSIEEDIRMGRMFNVIHLKSMHKIDFIVLKNDVFEKTKFERRQLKTFMDLELWVISPEDLILSKLQWIQTFESDLQKRDIINLLSVKYLDLDYVNIWIRRLQLNTYDLIF